MKKFFLFLSAGLLMTACSDDAPVLETGGEQQVTLSFNLPETINSRATGGSNSALGGASNCDGNVTFTAALYYGDNLVWEDNATTTASSNASVTFTPTLVVGETYQLVAYAKLGDDVVSLTSVSVPNSINDESVDAYFVTQPIVAEPTMSATLKRATGKLRIIAEDFTAAINQLGKTVNTVTITYKQAQADEFSPKSDVWNTATASTVSFTSDLATYDVENESGAKTILVDYIPATATGEIINIENVVVTFSDNTTYTKDLSKLDIPVKRNYLTTLTGNFFTAESDLTLELDDAFAGEEDVNYDILSAFEFGGEYTLEQDVTLNSSLSLAAGKSLVLNLNGHNITVTTESTAVEEGDAIIAYGNLTIKGEGTVTGNTRAVWARGNDGAVVNIEGGTFIGATASEKSSTIYASGNGTVNIYGGTFEAEQPDKTSYANKDGVYAAINMHDACTGGVNVYGGTFVKFNPAVPGTELASWITAHPNGFVAEGYSSLANGENWVVVASGANGATVADSAAEAAEALSNGTSVVLANDIDATESLVIANGTTLDGNGYTLAVNNATAKYITNVKGDATIQNLNIVGDNSTVEGASTRALYFSNDGNYVIDNVSVSGVGYALNVNCNPYSLKVSNSELNGWCSWSTNATEEVVFNNVKFGISTYYTDNEMFNGGIRAYSNTTFSNCEFAAGYWISLIGIVNHNAKLTFENCTVNGEQVTADNFSTLFNVEKDDATVISDYVVVK